MKPFNLTEALAGKPVVTRSGVEIPPGSFVPVPQHPDAGCRLLVVFPQGHGFAYPHGYYHENGMRTPYPGTLDLFMKPVFKTGVLNIYKHPVDGRIFCSDHLYPSVAEALLERPIDAKKKHFKTRIALAQFAFEE